MRDFFLTDEPLWLPPGSVRSVIALAVVAGYLAGIVAVDVLLLVIGFYFGTRANGG